MQLQNTFFQSPVGIIEIKATDECINSVLFTNTRIRAIPGNGTPENAESIHPLVSECQKQLLAYFAGTRRQFDLPLQQHGSAFQQKVWSELTNIPYGTTISYLELSKRIGNTKAIRAVGKSNGQNTISIIVPCHRVIASNGELTGYRGDLWRKKWLLGHEGKYANGIQTLF